MRISILIPCHNEERSIAACVNSCLNQTLKPDEILVVNDGSTDNTAKILASFGDKIKVLTIPVATGNKSHAQEQGLKHITGDVFIATDADTILVKDFVKVVAENFNNRKVAALAGYVRSRKYNWLTACRAFEYAVGQNLHKIAQHYMGFLFVIPGAAGVFHTKTFFENISFEHDTLTEDLDFTYRLHKKGLEIVYDRRLIVFTQDPTTLYAYTNQMRRWFGGGWQCLLKHVGLATEKPKVALELSLMYLEGITFSLLLFLLPFLSMKFYFTLIVSYLVTAHIFAFYASWKERRLDLLHVPVPYLLLVYINSYIFLEQMFKEVVMRKKSLFWFKPERI